MRILIVRTSAMGDIVHCLPVLIALRRHLPEAKIAWVVERTFAPLLEGHPDIDELILVRLREWRKQPLSAAVLREVATFRQTLRRFAPDVALDLMGNHKGGAIAWLSGAKRRLGAARSLRREASSAIWLNEADAKRRLEDEILRTSVAEAWAATESYWRQRDPKEVEKAERDGKHKMALVFRSYLGQSSKWAIAGDQDRRLDYQIWCGPAMGAFNAWVRGSFLEPPGKSSGRAGGPKPHGRCGCRNTRGPAQKLRRTDPRCSVRFSPKASRVVRSHEHVGAQQHKASFAHRCRRRQRIVPGLGRKQRLLARHSRGKRPDHGRSAVALVDRGLLRPRSLRTRQDVRKTRRVPAASRLRSDGVRRAAQHRARHRYRAAARPDRGAACVGRRSRLGGRRDRSRQDLGDSGSHVCTRASRVDGQPAPKAGLGEGPSRIRPAGGSSAVGV